MARRISLHDVRLPPNLLKDIDTELMVKLSEDDGSAFAEFLDSVDLEDVRNITMMQCTDSYYTAKAVFPTNQPN